MTASRPSVAGPVAAVAVVVLLVVVNVVRSTLVPSPWHFAFNVSYGVVVVALGVACMRLDAEEIGLSRASLGRGLRWGATVFAVVGVVAGVAVLAASGRNSLDVNDAHLALGSFIVKVAIVIPLGTVLPEELVFRGVLHGLLRRRLDIRRATAVGAGVFGLWHVFPAWRADGALTALGTLVVTAIAGAVFVWLRERSGSLVAPVLAHLATNTVPLTIGWLILR